MVFSRSPTQSATTIAGHRYGKRNYPRAPFRAHQTPNQLDLILLTRHRVAESLGGYCEVLMRGFENKTMAGSARRAVPCNTQTLKVSATITELRARKVRTVEPHPPSCPNHDVLSSRPPQSGGKRVIQQGQTRRSIQKVHGGDQIR